MPTAREREENRKLRLIALAILPPIIGGIFWLVFGAIGYLWNLSAADPMSRFSRWGQTGFLIGFPLTVVLIVRALILGK